MKKITVGICLLGSLCCVPLLSAMQTNKIPQNIALRLTELNPEKSNVKNIIGMSEDQYPTKDHPYFTETRQKYGIIRSTATEVENLIKNSGLTNGPREISKSFYEHNGSGILNGIKKILETAKGIQTKKQKIIDKLDMVRFIKLEIEVGLNEGFEELTAEDRVWAINEGITKKNAKDIYKRHYMRSILGILRDLKACLDE